MCNREVRHKEVSWILPPNLKLTSWSQIENIFARYECVASEVQASNIGQLEVENCDTEDLIESIKSKFELLKIQISDDENTVGAKLSFLAEQFNLMFSRKNNYSVDTMLFACMIQMHSPA